MLKKVLAHLIIDDNDGRQEAVYRTRTTHHTNTSFFQPLVAGKSFSLIYFWKLYKVLWASTSMSENQFIVLECYLVVLEYYCCIKDLNSNNSLQKYILSNTQKN